MKQTGKFHHPNSWHEARLHHGIRHSFRVPDHHLYHGGTRDGIIAAKETVLHGGGLCHEKEVYIMVADIIMEWKARKDS